MSDTELAAIHAELDLLRLHLATARDGEAMALAAVAILRQQVTAFSQATLDDMDAANEPDPQPAHDTRRVMPARALRRQHAPGGLWTPDDAPGVAL
jgi:hypothetical protein